MFFAPCLGKKLLAQGTLEHIGCADNIFYIFKYIRIVKKYEN